MEEELIKKKNETNNNSSNGNGIIAFLVVIIIALVGVIIYLAFIKKDNEPINNNGTINQVNDNSNDKTNQEEQSKNNEQVVIENKKFTKVEKIKLDSNNKEVIVNNKKIKLKALMNDDNYYYLYVDDKNTQIEISCDLEESDNEDENLRIPYVEITDYLILAYSATQGSDRLNIILNENGEKFSNDILDKIYIPKVYVENGKLMAQEYDIDLDEYSPTDLYEIKYDGKDIELVKVK